jgi:hypothetical protein
MYSMMGRLLEQIDGGLLTTIAATFDDFLDRGAEYLKDMAPSASSPTRKASSIRKKMPEITSRTRPCAPKPMAMPTTPSPARSEPMSRRGRQRDDDRHDREPDQQSIAQ